MLQKYTLFTIFCFALHSSLSIEALAQTLDEALDREANGLSMHEFQSYHKIIEFDVKAAKEPTLIYPKDSKNTHVAILDIGSDSAIECQLFNKEVFLAREISNHFAQNFKDINSLEVKESSIVLRDEVPHLRVDFLYSFLDEEQNPIVGMVKYLGKSWKENSVLCVHDEVGYRNNFEEISLQISQSYRNSYHSEKKEKPSYHAVYEAKVGDTILGLNEFRVYAAYQKQDQVTSANLFTFLTPLKQQALSSYNTLSNESSHAEGVLKSGVYLLQDEEENLRVELSSNRKRKKYQVKTIEDGEKSSKSKFKVDNSIWGTYGHYQKSMKAFFDEDQKSLNLTEYNPFLQPLELTEVEMKALEKDEDSAMLEMTAGKQTRSFRLYDGKLPKEFAFGEGPHALKLKMIFEKGEFPARK